eukprot:7697554-Pyramimonas_sp.AAC.1
MRERNEFRAGHKRADTTQTINLADMAGSTVGRWGRNLVGGGYTFNAGTLMVAYIAKVRNAKQKGMREYTRSRHQSQKGRELLRERVKSRHFWEVLKVTFGKFVFPPFFADGHRTSVPSPSILSV